MWFVHPITSLFRFLPKTNFLLIHLAGMFVGLFILWSTPAFSQARSQASQPKKTVSENKKNLRYALIQINPLRTLSRIKATIPGEKSNPSVPHNFFPIAFPALHFKPF